jgi:hypothetical protein
MNPLSKLKGSLGSKFSCNSLHSKLYSSFHSFNFTDSTPSVEDVSSSCYNSTHTSSCSSLLTDKESLGEEFEGYDDSNTLEEMKNCGKNQLEIIYDDNNDSDKGNRDDEDDFDKSDDGDDFDESDDSYEYDDENRNYLTDFSSCSGNSFTTENSKNRKRRSKREKNKFLFNLAWDSNFLKNDEKPLSYLDGCKRIPENVDEVFDDDVVISLKSQSAKKKRFKEVEIIGSNVFEDGNDNDNCSDGEKDYYSDEDNVFLEIVNRPKKLKSVADVTPDVNYDEISMEGDSNSASAGLFIII